MNLVELKRLLAEAKLEPNWQCWDETKADLIVAAVNALPELIAIAELAGANAFESLSMAYAAGRADQRKADVEIARDYGDAVARRPSREDAYEIGHAQGAETAAESIAKAIEEQDNAPQNA